MAGFTNAGREYPLMDPSPEAAVGFLRQLLGRGLFHHATARYDGKLWDGLYVYAKDLRGFRGFSLATSFPRGSRAEAIADELVRGTGVSFGAYGRG